MAAAREEHAAGRQRSCSAGQANAQYRGGRRGGVGHSQPSNVLLYVCLCVGQMCMSVLICAEVGLVLLLHVHFKLTPFQHRQCINTHISMRTHAYIKPHTHS